MTYLFKADKHANHTVLQNQINTKSKQMAVKAALIKVGFRIVNIGSCVMQLNVIQQGKNVY